MTQIQFSVYIFNPDKKTEELIENCMRECRDEIDDQTFSKIKGKLFYLLTNQNSSRIFQKCVKNTHYSIIYGIFYEVNTTLRKDLSSI